MRNQRGAFMSNSRLFIPVFFFALSVLTYPLLEAPGWSQEPASQQFHARLLPLLIASPVIFHLEKFQLIFLDSEDISGPNHRKLCLTKFLNKLEPSFCFLLIWDYIWRCSGLSSDSTWAICGASEWTRDWPFRCFLIRNLLITWTSSQTSSAHSQRISGYSKGLDMPLIPCPLIPPSLVSLFYLTAAAVPETARSSEVPVTEGTTWSLLCL